MAWFSVTPVGYSDRRTGVQLEEKTNLIQNDPLTVLKPGMGLSLLVHTMAAKKPKDSVARGHVLEWRTSALMVWVSGSRGSVLGTQALLLSPVVLIRTVET